MAWPGRSWLADYRELVIVLVAAVIGLTVQAPLAAVVRHQGVNILLAILVFSTGLSIEPRTLRQLPSRWRPLVIALLVGISVLPAISWLAGFLVPSGPLRDGIITVGLAPCEIASMATTGMAGGSIVLAGGLLIGSTVLSVVASGPILSWEQQHASVHPAHIVTNLLLVVALPLALALLVRARLSLPPRAEVITSNISTLSVAALVALIASQTHLELSYLRVVGGLLLFLAVTIGVGHLLGRRDKHEVGRALLLTTSMRDFAIAASLAATAFGPRAAAPLGLYGIMVLAWGTGSAGFMRSRAVT